MRMFGDGWTGKFVSESKFVENPSAFIPHIRSRNKEALAALITKPEVERRLLQRLRKKASTYAQDYAADGEPIPLANGNGNGAVNGHGGGGGTIGKLDVEGVVELYESYIIPLTKDVEVRCFPSCVLVFAVLTSGLRCLVVG